MSRGRWVSLSALFHRAFARPADAERHVDDRNRFAACGIAVPFRTAVATVNGIAWAVFAAIILGGVFGMPASGKAVIHRAAILSASGTGVPDTVLIPILHGLVTVLAGGLGRAAILRGARFALQLQLRRRRIGIERTLPGAVRYLHVISAGTTDPASLLEGVVDRADVHGETARSFERVLATAAVCGDLDTAIRRVARQSASPDVLAPFLRSFLEQSREGPDALRQFLERESRLMAQRDERDLARERGTFRLVLGSFLVLLVLPTVAVVGLAAASVFLPTLHVPTSLPFLPLPFLSLPWFGAFRSPQLQRVVSIGGGAAILALGLLVGIVIAAIRPHSRRWTAGHRGRGIRDILQGIRQEPSDTLLLALPGGLLLILILYQLGVDPVSAGLLGYAGVGLTVGLVDRRRARVLAAKDRRLPAFVHAVADRLDRGLPFATAVNRVADEQDFGALQPDVADLSFTLRVGTDRRPVRKAALERFVEHVGTPLAGRTIGLATGALEAGSDTATAFEAMGSETGRLAHAARARRARLPLVVAVGWLTALFVIAVVVVLNLLATGTTAPTGPGPTEGVVVDLALTPLNADRPGFYLIAQAAMMGSGWFAGVAGRGVYEGLLHSGGLVLVTFAVFRVTGLL
ncbi:MAG: hypothetical protein ABEI31_04235 [Halodesulfurarchaeum sp.]